MTKMEIVNELKAIENDFWSSRFLTLTQWLHNQIEDMKGQTRVYARVRPMDAEERDSGSKEICIRDGKQTLVSFCANQKHWSYTHVFQNPSREAAAVAAAQAEMHRELAGLSTSLADGYNILVLVAGPTASGKTLTLVGDLDEAQRAGGFLLPEENTGTRAAADTAASCPTTEQLAEDVIHKRGVRKGKDKPEAAGGPATDASAGRGVAARPTPLAGLFPRIVAEAFATLTHRKAHCAFTVHVSAAAVSASAATSADDRNAAVECLLPTPPTKSGTMSDASGGDVDSGQSTEEAEHPVRPPPSPPDDVIWGRVVSAVSPHEAVAIVEAARSRATTVSTRSPSDGCTDKHFLSRVRVELTNHSTKEASACEMVIAELVEEKTGDTWASELAEVIREHATQTTGKSDRQNGKDAPAYPLLGMVRPCLRDTAKVMTIVCLSPAESQADGTERVLEFGKACQDSGEGVVLQLRDLKKELARLKKENKGLKRTPTSQLPRPAGGRRG